MITITLKSDHWINGRHFPRGKVQFEMTAENYAMAQELAQADRRVKHEKHFVGSMVVTDSDGIMEKPVEDVDPGWIKRPSSSGDYLDVK